MKKVIKLGLVYIADPGWTGGSDYVVNLVNAFTFLPRDIKPEVVLFVEDSVNLNELKSKLFYSNYTISIVRKNKSKVWRFLNKIGIYTLKKYKYLKIIYPFPKNIFYQRFFLGVPSYVKVFWIPDFQEEHYPEFFSEAEITRRRKSRSEILCNPENLVVYSSESALRDKKRFYPDALARSTVLRFANPSGIAFENNDVEQCLQQYGVSQCDYFICPNQFWKHKNHRILLEAVRILKQRGFSVRILLTGREEDSRDLAYFPGLKKSVHEEGLSDSIAFLGFIPKKDLYTLMKYSRAMIQPSLFEGWSTTIEDAISLNVPVICSDLEVNKEQMGNRALYFDPRDPHKLAELLSYKGNFKKPDFDLPVRSREFALKFMEIADMIRSHDS